MSMDPADAFALSRLNHLQETQRIGPRPGQPGFGANGRGAQAPDPVAGEGQPTSTPASNLMAPHGMPIARPQPLPAQPSAPGTRRLLVAYGPEPGTVMLCVEEAPDWDVSWRLQVPHGEVAWVSALMTALGVKVKDLTGLGKEITHDRLEEPPTANPGPAAPRAAPHSRRTGRVDPDPSPGAPAGDGGPEPPAQD